MDPRKPLQLKFINPTDKQIYIPCGTRLMDVVLLPVQRPSNIVIQVAEKEKAKEEPYIKTPRKTDVKRAMKRLNLKRTDFTPQPWKQVRRMVREILPAIPLDSIMPGTATELPKMKIEYFTRNYQSS